MRHEARPVQATFSDGRTGEVQIQFPVREKNRVYIVGTASTKDIIPWNDPDAEYWGVNNLYGVTLTNATGTCHYDRWFEIHNLWLDPATNKFLRRGDAEFRGQPVLDYLKGIANLGCTVYMQKHWPDLIPMSVQYPLQEVVAFFQEKGIDLRYCRYLTNTITYEIVLAIYLGFQDIQVWGVDMQAGTEYGWQRPSCEFWLGVAAGLGIKIHIPEEADLLKCRFIYGFEEKQQDDFRRKLEKIRKDMKIKRIQAQQQVAENERHMQQLLGAENVVTEIQNIWTNLGDDLLLTKRGS
jgi:hypothetical protein